MTFTVPSETAKSSGDFFNLGDHDGRLVAFYGGRDEGEIPTQFGTTTAAHCDLVVVLDAPDGPAAFTDVLIFAKVIQQAVKAADPVLGVLKRGEAKPGKSAPYILVDPDNVQAEAANAWHSKNVIKNGNTWLYKPDEAPF